MDTEEIKKVIFKDLSDILGKEEKRIVPFYKKKSFISILFLSFFFIFCLSPITPYQAQKVKNWVSEESVEHSKTHQKIHTELKQKLGYYSYKKMNQWTFIRVFFELKT